MMDMFALSESSKYFPSPRTINTHYRPDVLPEEFRKAKTVVVLRNPKDACVSWHHHEVNISANIDPARRGSLSSLTLTDSIHRFLYDKDVPYGSYFDLTEYMWSLRDEPNILLIFYEDLKLSPVDTIQKLNEFMGTDLPPEMIQQIADATEFNKMRNAKLNFVPSEAALKLMKAQRRDPQRSKNVTDKLYRRGKIGDWRNHITVADNEIFDRFLAQWSGGKDIPFKY
ncbi:sulfotransferase 1C2A-like [Watersipora subatra]|uniref:sulfotransferase 1C2A-like n=1 Tax=Watersipora subatra TaxID=2589382 RepID=UPI00355BEC0D